LSKTPSTNLTVLSQSHPAPLPPLPHSPPPPTTPSRIIFTAPHPPRPSHPSYSSPLPPSLSAPSSDPATLYYRASALRRVSRPWLTPCSTRPARPALAAAVGPSSFPPPRGRGTVVEAS